MFTNGFFNNSNVVVVVVVVVWGGGGGGVEEGGGGLISRVEGVDDVGLFCSYEAQFCLNPSTLLNVMKNVG